MPETSGSEDKRRLSWLARVIAGWAGEGVKKGVEEIVGYKPEEFQEVQRGRGEGNPVAAFIGRKAGELKGDIVKGLGEDQEVKTSVQESVSKSLSESVNDMKTNFKPALDKVNTKLKNETDRRSTYDKMKDLLGYNESENFFVKLVKKAGARILCVGIPVVSFISAKIASRFTGVNAEEGEYRKKFSQIYDSALGRMTVHPAAPAA